MPAGITEQELVSACRETLQLWPQARAAILFGSRARGTSHPDSDWDVAIVLEGNHPDRPSPACSISPHSKLPADLPRVDLWALSEEDLRRNAGTLGTLPYVVCRDGRVIAGNWNRPNPLQPNQEPSMRPQNWATRMRQVLQKIDTSLIHITTIAETPLWADTDVHCAALLQTTADAAELLVKAAMERRGVAADRTHDIAVLTTHFSAQRPDQTHLAQQMAALNGGTRMHPTAMYEFQPPAAPHVHAAITRLTRTLNLWANELDTTDNTMAGQIPRLTRTAASTMTSWPHLIRTPVTPKPDQDPPSQAAAEAALDARTTLCEAIDSFRHRIRQLIAAQAD